MITVELLEIIGSPVGSVVIAGRYGNATLHRKGWWSCDPCYLPKELNEEICAAHRAAYPWENRDYRLHNVEWMPFELGGHTLYARSCADGDGYFGNCVDAGWIVCFPNELAPEVLKIHILEAA